MTLPIFDRWKQVRMLTGAVLVMAIMAGAVSLSVPGWTMMRDFNTLGTYVLANAIAINVAVRSARKLRQT